MTVIESLGKCWSGAVTLGPIEWRGLLVRLLPASVLMGAIVVVLEPDHTAELSFLTAVGLWSLHIFFILLIFAGSLTLLRHGGLSDLLASAVAILLSPLLFAPVSLLLDSGFGNPDEELTGAAGFAGAYLIEVVDVAPVTLIAALALSCALYKRALSRETAVLSPEAESRRERPELKALIQAVPAALGNDIVRMQSQDHYVEVVTLEGRALIMERFSDCVRQLNQMDGFQCHRSHWISLRHAKSLSRAGSAYLCLMDNGDQVPVSRRRYAKLKHNLSRAAASKRY